ncbi:MAG: permease [candidate division KSB1 bacterium]|nr:permease [candidate division KSB1 bacterium]MDZ7303704.1 permease [candidate division KSB1 bacterium]MDZ7313160.1 permease [candidate division KSB1 bacterium]
MPLLLNLLHAGGSALLEYLSAHVLTCLVPAFFIAGSIRVFISQASILKYMGPQANRATAFGIASISGTVLAVCSCTVIPMFAGMYLGGAGIGPSSTFLYSGPAINIMALVYSARLLGLDIGLGRSVGAIGFAIVIGLIMAALFHREEQQRAANEVQIEIGESDHSLRRMLFFVSWIGVLVFAAAKWWWPTLAALLVIGAMLRFWFEKDEILNWLQATWGLVWLILPWLLGGVFIAGMLRELLPEHVVQQWVGENSLTSNFVASLFGALMYFATLTEVPIVKAFLQLGMSKGPALALLLAGPALSLPSMLAIYRIFGFHKTAAYIFLVVVFATIAGWMFGSFF